MKTSQQPEQTLSINSNNLSLGGDEVANAAALDKSLAAFTARPTIQGAVNSNSTYPQSQPIVEDDEVLLEAPTELPDTSEPPEETSEPGEFDVQFKERFGVDTAEAIETINSLVAFKSEMQLMREWGVSPTDYDGRMGDVKEFYNTLPEDKQAEFNTVEGAKAIWSHLEKTSPKVKSTNSKVGSARKSSPAPTQVTIKKSELLKMDKATYTARLPEITKAWREGRVVEDV